MCPLLFCRENMTRICHLSYYSASVVQYSFLIRTRIGLLADELFPPWEQNIPSLGIKRSQPGNKKPAVTALLLNVEQSAQCKERLFSNKAPLMFNNPGLFGNTLGVILFPFGEKYFPSGENIFSPAGIFIFCRWNSRLTTARPELQSGS